jgi:hypothetical protein
VVVIGNACATPSARGSHGFEIPCIICVLKILSSRGRSRKLNKLHRQFKYRSRAVRLPKKNSCLDSNQCE